MDKSSFRLKMEVQSKKTLAKIQIELQEHWKDSMNKQFLENSTVVSRLQESLRIGNRLDLLDRTLLTPSVHQFHHENLYKKFNNRYQKIKDNHHKSITKFNVNNTDKLFPLSDQDLTDNHIRSFTLLDSVCVIDHKTALQSALKMKQQLMEVVGRIKGVKVLGVIEGEIISIKRMTEIKDKDDTDESEKRKLKVCKKLREDISNSVHYLVDKDTSLFFIHFHGIVFSTKPSRFELFRNELHKIHQWNKTKYQVEIKQLSKEWKKIPRTTEENLKFWSIYMTKGGQDWNSGKLFLRYKNCMGYDKIPYKNSNDWLTRNIRRQSILKEIDNSSDENGKPLTTDKLSLSAKEILELTLFIDGLMNLNKTRTGYIINV